MQKRAIVSTVIMTLILMGSCDPPVSKPATTTATGTTTALDTTTVADTGTVATENPQPVQPENEPVQPENEPVQPENEPVQPENEPVVPENEPVAPADIAEKMAASVKAAQAVQSRVTATKDAVNIVESAYRVFSLQKLNEVIFSSPRFELRTAKTSLGFAKRYLADTTDTGLKMLSQKAVEVAKAIVTVRSSATADDAVAKAEAVKTAADKTDDPSAYFQTAAAEAEVVTDMDLTEDAKAVDYTAITAAKTQVDALKKLADDAVVAAKAVVTAEAVAAAKAVQSAIDELKMKADTAVTNLGDTLENLNAQDGGGVGQAKAKATRILLVEVNDALKSKAPAGLKKLSVTAIQIAKAFKSRAGADDAVAAAKAVDAAIKSKDEAALLKTASAALRTFSPVGGNLSESNKNDFTTAARSVQTLVDALKQLADDAVAAAQAVQ